jgi:hypothetical protein
LTLRDLCEYAGVSMSTANRWVNSGVRGKVLPSFWLGGRRQVTRTDLDDFLAELQEGVAHAAQ